MAMSDGTGFVVVVTGTSSESEVGSQLKHTPCVLAGHVDQFVDRHPSNQRNPLRYVAHKAGLVALTPMGDRGEIGAVGLQQQPVDRSLENGVVQPPVLE